MSSRPPVHSDTAENVNREQQDDGQANDVADDALHPGRGLGESERAPGNIADTLPDDVPDLIDRMNEMVRSGHIDNDAYSGEPMHDDEENIMGPTDSEDDDIMNPDADGNEDPLAGIEELPETNDETIIGTGNDPLAERTGGHGIENDDETAI